VKDRHDAHLVGQGTLPVFHWARADEGKNGFHGGAA